jgi:2,4-dienoyl-CoA reductase-like NADH-dependent reductase (Old Yellow Enzyme family)
MTQLFDPGRIGTMETKNRIVRSPTGERMGDERGWPTEMLEKHYVDLAKGGTGLIIVGITWVRDDGMSSPNGNRMDDDGAIPGWRAIVDKVHALGAKITIQIGHTGRQLNPIYIGGRTPIAPSPVTYLKTGVTPRAMTEEEILELIQSFIQAGRRVKEAGFDGVQLHGAHGDVINQFLSPYTNRRTDRWGGSLENRMRFVVEIYNGLREALGKEYPIFIKTNISDCDEEGIKENEGLRMAEHMAEIGMDAIEISGGTLEKSIETVMAAHIKTEEQEAYFLPFSEKLKPRTNTPVILVGGMRSLNVMDRIIKEEKADFISICRPLIREPDLPLKLERGEQTKALCISCNKCFDIIYKNEPVACIFNLDKEERERIFQS